MTGAGFGPEVVAACAARMRSCAARAHADALVLSGVQGAQALVRMRLFAEAAADLAGSSVQQELGRASGLSGEPAWVPDPVRSVSLLGAAGLVM